MLNETFYIDGVDARNFGIYLQRPVEFSETAPVVEIQSIPGRNGDLVFETGSYENRTGTASCFCLRKDVEKAISASGRFLMSKHGYRRLETSDDPDHFWLARIENSPQIMQRMRTLAPFEISFDCKPQRFLKSGEEMLVFEAEEADGGLFGIKGNLNNSFGFPALPLVTIYADDSGTEGKIFDFRIRNKETSTEKRIIGTINDGVINLDCDTHNAYNHNGNQNRNIITYEFPSLFPGENEFEVFGLGIKKVKFTPRWWEL
jgi:phage-related protein